MLMQFSSAKFGLNHPMLEVSLQTFQVSSQTLCTDYMSWAGLSYQTISCIEQQLR